MTEVNMTGLPKKVLIIGLDGATFDLVHPWAAAGYLPNLARLMAEGSQGQLLSTIQPVTAPAWASFMTGVNQGKHGLYDFVRRRVGEYRLEVTNGSHIRSPGIFDLASRQGKRVITINMPYTFPPRPINGVAVAGPFIPALTPESVYPQDFYTELKSVVPDYDILPDYNPYHPDPLTDYAEKLAREIAWREELSLHLMHTRAWDLFSVVFMATDEVQHTFWHCLEAPDGSPHARHRQVVRALYQRADQAIGNLVSQAAEEAQPHELVVFILSDHGAGPLKWVINLNRWLAESGYLRFLPNRGNRLRLGYSQILKRSANLYRRLVPAGLRFLLRRRLGADRFEHIKGNLEGALLTSAIDWSQTRAYALGAGGNLFINLQGREPAGTVAEGQEYEAICRQLITDLYDLTDPETGERLIKKVYRRAELYDGPFLELAPDLIIQWKNYAYWGRGRYDSQATTFEAQNRLEFSDIPLTGTHRPEGLLITWGAGIRPGSLITGARLLDLAPNILRLLAIRPPVELDGHFLPELYTAELLTELAAINADAYSTSETSRQTFTPEEEAAIAERLRSLGYL
jgi:predicted AlkP superfamily phosphohydrolase/phosphomutase